MSRTFQILSLDGGGIKGLFSAAILSRWEDDLSTSIVKHFDLIVGTSTGGIIALGLGLGLLPGEIVNFYVSNSKKIFCRKSLGLFRNKYSHEPLKSILKSDQCFGNKLLGESKKRLVIPSYNLVEDGIYLFKTYHHDQCLRDYKTPAWKVALATSAAPIFFPVYKEVDNLRLIDGGVWANNPSMVGIIEAVSFLGVSFDQIRILSLGTTDEIVNRPKNLDNAGLFQWALPSIKVVLRGQNKGVDSQIRLLLGEDNVLRIDPPVPDKLFELDKLSVKELLGVGSGISKNYAQDFKRKFMTHIAEEFKPLRKC